MSYIHFFKVLPASGTTMGTTQRSAASTSVHLNAMGIVQNITERLDALLKKCDYESLIAFARYVVALTNDMSSSSAVSGKLCT